MGVSADSEIDMDDARTIAEWAVEFKRIPPLNRWLEGDDGPADPMGHFI